MEDPLLGLDDFDLDVVGDFVVVEDDDDSWAAVSDDADVPSEFASAEAECAAEPTPTADEPPARAPSPLEMRPLRMERDGAPPAPPPESWSAAVDGSEEKEMSLPE